ncbi:hypothetical protein [Citrobacter amalonaticus]|uniref:hypothetical protein n=1 Tax=Citrobacter amalonaticus TaxID=35703 RepID=UPI000621F2AE|nr:hypothetical protein [Citrobacter amalonaticus]KKF68308.1 hypothetical protein XU19_18035 [Vibrio parahaemolyticus]KKY40142.1 hypothetical protein AAY51_23190 [Vibrio parahaemolyticus]KOP97025.1 hypothetical protein AL012_06750 [Citrobacter amalonaticus]KOP98401.1 hypothetical protein ALC61_09855 [Citrobacter amalonaticus]
MDSNIIELVKLGHERADELKASCGAVDVRSVAQLISDLASQLEVQLVRSNTLAAENAGLKASGNKMFLSAVSLMEDPELKIDHARDIKDWERIKTPATDAFLAEVRAQGVEEFLRGSQLPYQIATVLADYDNVDDATLQTVIWSGQPPEPDGDVWHLEYVSRGNAIVHAVLKELRKGVQS